MRVLYFRRNLGYKNIFSFHHKFFALLLFPPLRIIQGTVAYLLKKIVLFKIKEVSQKVYGILQGNDGRN